MTIKELRKKLDNIKEYLWLRKKISNNKRNRRKTSRQRSLEWLRSFATTWKKKKKLAKYHKPN